MNSAVTSNVDVNLSTNANIVLNQGANVLPQNIVPHYLFNLNNPPQDLNKKFVVFRNPVPGQNTSLQGAATTNLSIQSKNMVVKRQQVVGRVKMRNRQQRTPIRFVIRVINIDQAQVKSS